ncbi:phosphatidylinositol N-acetylglucosaminyltransferase subunit P-like [Haliotis asinina]|uniref:phosphatidylinositol N-acetylglucosaminyltransferase subunit P-like n=1 Tax=Haliotis asinina TaxID=109174 RepID=UPI003531F8AD
MASPSPTPERAVLGFFLYLFSYILFGVYLVWAYIPDSWLDAAGLTYWPSKHWGVTLPVYVCVLVLLAYLVYFGLFLFNSPPLTSVHTITDEYSHDASEYPVPLEEAIPPLCDMSVSEVSRLLYLKGKVTS